MLTSIKHILRTPLRCFLFFLLIAASAALLVLGSVLYAQTSQRIESAGDQFVTIGTVEQKPQYAQPVILPDSCSDVTMAASQEVYKELLDLEDLLFPGAVYRQPPETRVCYLANIPGLNALGGVGSVDDVYVMEFTPLEDIPSPQAASVQVERLLYARTASQGVYTEPPQEGGTISLCNHFTREFSPLRAGHRYIAVVVLDFLTGLERGEFEYVVYTAPFSTQTGEDGLPAAGAAIHMANGLQPSGGQYLYTAPGNNIPPEPSAPVYAEEVTEDFYAPGGRGALWENWAAQLEALGKEKAYFQVLATNDWELLPSFHEKSAIIAAGRAITPEEFAQGAAVCLVPEELARQNLVEIGDRLPLSMVCAMKGGWPVASAWCSAFSGAYSTLDATGESYSPFWEAEYEIVGIYRTTGRSRDLGEQMLIIPSASVAADSVNLVYVCPMNALTTSFLLPNGTVEEFDRALREAVPQAAELTVTYDDNGYSQVREGLENARATALLLCAAGGFLAVGVIVLLLYFFVVREQKRTAIERSLGMTKRQCRVSLLCGLLLLTITAATVGSIGGRLLVHMEAAREEAAQVQDTEEEASGYSTQYSLWARTARASDVLEEEASPLPIEALIGIPLGFLCAVWLLGLLLVNRNMRVDPIYLLGGKGE